MQYLRDVVSPKDGIGAREAGTEQEQQTADYVIAQFKSMGFDAHIQKIKRPVLQEKNKYLYSSNIIVEKKGRSDKVLVLAAHFDSTGSKQGSQGAMDNGSGLAVMLAVAGAMSQEAELPYTLRFIAFGAEEIGLVGSRAYMKQLQQTPDKLKKIIGMVNLDTVAGGDFLYLHSAHTEPYECGGNNDDYTSDTVLRDALVKVSRKVLSEHAHRVHPEFPVFPEGVTGPWSDHEPFACNGIPVAYIETTNFTINGQDGYDGYSQSAAPGLWDCFDAKNKTACDREQEKQWGMIWHTGNDQLKHLELVFPGRVERQLSANVAVLNEFFIKADKYLGF